MASIKLEGTIVLIGETQSVGTSGFTKRDFVLEIDGTTQYPQTVQIQATKDRCQTLDAFGAGQAVEVDVNLRGRAWTSPQGETKYFNTLEACRITAKSASASAPAMAPIPPQNLQPGYDDVGF